MNEGKTFLDELQDTIKRLQNDGIITAEQIEASVKVMKEIIKYLKDKYNYDFIIDRNHIIGHNEINPVVRKKCPGSKFPFAEIISRLKL